MYKECTTATKAQALLLAKGGLLFWRDSDGAVRQATSAKVKSSWGIWEFFTCTHAKPRGFVS